MIFDWIDRSAPFNTSHVMFPVERMNVHVCEWILTSAQPFSACLRILIINKMYLYVFWLMRRPARTLMAAVQMIKINISTVKFMLPYFMTCNTNFIIYYCCVNCLPDFTVGFIGECFPSEYRYSQCLVKRTVDSDTDEPFTQFNWLYDV